MDSIEKTITWQPHRSLTTSFGEWCLEIALVYPGIRAVFDSLDHGQGLVLCCGIFLHWIVISYTWPNQSASLLGHDRLVEQKEVRSETQKTRKYRQNKRGMAHVPSESTESLFHHLLLRRWDTRKRLRPSDQTSDPYGVARNRDGVPIVLCEEWVNHQMMRNKK